MSVLNLAKRAGGLLLIHIVYSSSIEVLDEMLPMIHSKNRRVKYE